MSAQSTITGLAVVVNDDGLVPHLVKIEKAIKGNDLESLEMRHAFGMWLIGHQPKNVRKLPNGVRAEILAACDISATEFKNRAKLAQVIPKNELVNALTNWGSWYEICKGALWGKKPPGATVPRRTQIALGTVARQCAKKLTTNTRPLTAGDKRELHKLLEAIAALLEETSS